MADKYGNDSDFKEMTEKMNKNYSTLNNSPPVDISNVGGVSKQISPQSNSTVQVSETQCDINDLDKNSWEYWERRSKNAFSPYDGSSAAVKLNHQNKHDTKKH